MDFQIDDVVFAHQLEQDDIFRYENQDYRAHRIEDADLIVIRAEVLTDNDDYVTLNLEADTKVELLIVA